MSANPLECLLVRFAPIGGGEAITLPAPSDLRYDIEYPGGFKSMSCSFSMPTGGGVPSALHPLSEVSVVDRRSGSIVWHGELTDPGLESTATSMQFSVTAEGAQMRADGWRQVYGIVDRSQDSWQEIGEFSGSNTSIGGDLAPDGDYTIDLGDYGDALNFGDELAINFGDILIGVDGTIDLDSLNIDLTGAGFGGDLGSFGNIDFSGADFPSPADYPAYLGFLTDPLGDFGDMLPIPLGPTDPPAGTYWIEGHSGTGGVATGESPTGVTLAPSSTSGDLGTSRRSADDTKAKMFIGGSFADDGMGGVTVIGDPDGVVSLIVTVELTNSAASGRVWFWADSSLNSSGWYVDINTSGSVKLYRVTSGTATLVSSVTKTIAVSTQYEIRILPEVFQWVVLPYGDIPHDGSLADTHWWNVYLDSDDGGELSYVFPGGILFDSANRYVGAAAAGTTSSDTVTFSNWEIRRTTDVED